MKGGNTWYCMIKACIQPAGNEGINRPDTDDSIPLPDDQRPVYPVEEPPGSDKPPMGDVDDSPKRLAHDGK